MLERFRAKLGVQIARLEHPAPRPNSVAECARASASRRSAARQDRRMTNSPSSSARSQHFLVVEPDPLFRLLLCVALSGQFSDFHAVASFGEAQALLTEQSFAAIISEQHLTGGTGLALYNESRRGSSDAPFILMCGGERVTLGDSNFRFFAKPFGLADLAETLAAMMAASPRR